jgi:hypothetical protein
MQNGIAEIIDTFFNGRPAPGSQPKQMRVQLTNEQMGLIASGVVLHFRAGDAEILVSIKKTGKPEA